jgi:hypothetical protein
MHIMFQYHPDILKRFPQVVGAAVLALYQEEQQRTLQRIGATPLSQLESLATWRRAFRD